jgi:hypothetical protein
MSHDRFADFLNEDAHVGLLRDRVSLVTNDVSTALRNLRFVSRIDFEQRHTLAYDQKTQISLSDLAEQHERLDDMLMNVTSRKRPTQVTLADARSLFVKVHNHALDLGEVLEGVAEARSHSDVRHAKAATDMLELASMALIGLCDAYAAGQQSITRATPARNPRRNTGKGGRHV